MKDNGQSTVSAARILVAGKVKNSDNPTTTATPISGTAVLPDPLA